MKGALIVESLRPEVTLELPMHVTKLTRFRATDATPDQPPQWTLLEFEAADGDADLFTGALSGALLDSGGWYVDFHTSVETFVVFTNRVFRYPRGDEDGRAQAQQHARATGVPESQIDWAD